jgi:hypothetical protein
MMRIPTIGRTAKTIDADTSLKLQVGAATRHVARRRDFVILPMDGLEDSTACLLTSI